MRGQTTLDVSELVNAFGIVLSTLVRALEDAKALPSGDVGRRMEVLPKAMRNTVAANIEQHPAVMEIIEVLADMLGNPTDTPTPWKPIIIKGGKDG